ncbi:MAG: methyl-accepting chemotaxis protein [Thermodesulfobacteria bacterium]|nr:methyl-accepting chemotaxis protein [Thermodesulfobacteriota bacterium]
MALLQRIRNLSCKTKIIAPVVTILVIFAVVLSFSLHHTLLNAEKSRLAKEIKVLGARIPVEIEDATVPAKVLVEGLANLNNFQFAVALKDKTLLDKSIAPVMKTLSQSKELSGFFTVYDPQGIVIFSTNSKIKPGTKIVAKRPMLIKAISTHEVQSGIEPGPTGLFLRCVAPVTYNGMFSGVIEFNIPMMQVFSKLKGESRDISIAWFIPNDLAESLGLKGKVKGSYFLGGVTEDFDESFPGLGKLLDESPGEMAIASTGKKAVSIMPLPFFGNQGQAAIAMMLDNQDSWHQMQRAIWKLAAGFAAIALFSALIINISIGFITKPLFSLMDYMQELAQGKFLRPSRYVAQDELGLLHKMANKVMAGTGKFCWHVKKDLKTLVEGASGLKSATKALEQESTSLNQVAGTVSEEIEHATGALSAIEEATQILQNSAATISENVVKTAEIANEAKEKADSTTEIIHSLENSSEKISDIIEVIKSISEQTNLLALNATIEAARAGEAGKGFAVVANEVKELAKQTGEATDEITSMIQAIQKDTRASVQAVDTITGVICEASRLSNTAAAATEEQNLAISEMNENLETASGRVATLNSTAGKLHEQAMKLSEVAEQIIVAHEGVVNSSKELDKLVSGYQVDKKAVDEAERLGSS